ncbi:MAG TPA: amidohydrolase family protein [Rhodanobacter sp.]
MRQVPGLIATVVLSLGLCAGCSAPAPPADAGISTSSGSRAAADAATAVRTIPAAASVPAAGAAASVRPAAATLFRNVRIFDGHSAELSAPSHVLVRGNLIERISREAIDLQPDGDVTIIDGDGRTLMPGLIDAHWHAMLAAVPMGVMMTADVGYLNLVAADEAEQTLLRGFTSVRDMAGPVFGLKRAIDEGVTVGPRIWPSGAMISQTGGHGDFRFSYEVPRTPNSPLSHVEAIGAGIVADGADQVLLRAREQLMLGASQLKLAAGGGVASAHDPLDVSQYTEAEIHAAVEAARKWGTYVTVHAYTPEAIQTAIRAGVKCIEHGQLMDEATARLMAEKGVWLSIQPFLDDQDAFPFPEGSSSRAKQVAMLSGTDTAYRLARKYQVKTAWGTDTLFDPKLARREGAQLAKMVRWYAPAAILTMATSNNAELLALSGPRNPYPGKLGVVEQGALADLLLVDGNPIADIRLVADPAKNFVVIMKDGKVYKNLLAR